MHPSLILGREPSLVLGLVAALIQLVSATVLHLTAEQQGVLNAVAVAAIGLITAAAVSTEKAAPAVVGLVQAGIACALAFGLHMTPEQQSSAMLLVTAAMSFWVRGQVTAPIPPTATR